MKTQQMVGVVMTRDMHRTLSIIGFTLLISGVVAVAAAGVALGAPTDLDAPTLSEVMR